MTVKAYQDPCNWFQVGWNLAAENPHLITIPTTLSNWTLYEFKAGVAAVMYQRTLPKHWLI